MGFVTAELLVWPWQAPAADYFGTDCGMEPPSVRALGLATPRSDREKENQNSQNILCLLHSPLPGSSLLVSLSLWGVAGELGIQQSVSAGDSTLVECAAEGTWRADFSN